jgi:hypothetical protein
MLKRKKSKTEKPTSGRRGGSFNKIHQEHQTKGLRTH